MTTVYSRRQIEQVIRPKKGYRTSLSQCSQYGDLRSTGSPA